MQVSQQISSPPSLQTMQQSVFHVGFGASWCSAQIMFRPIEVQPAGMHGTW